MEINEFAQTILFGNTMEDKLISPATFTDTNAAYTGDLPDRPVRPEGLAFADDIQKQKLPKLSALDHPTNRALMMHFFANHELLALELMALALLKFSDAPASFRMGIAYTIKEEQKHFSLYKQRIEELGVGFGEVGVNAFFWNALSQMRSPMDYVTQMSMTFEQANLDYAFFYGELFRRCEDPESAAIMDIIFQEEIGHLAYGVKWFNKWKQPNEDPWVAYRKQLSFPLSPSWAKGKGFCDFGRREAGLSEDFIRHLKVYSKSKGRPPHIYSFCPNTEDLPSLLATEKDSSLHSDFSELMLFLASQTDIVLTEEPSLRFLETLLDCGVVLPEFVSPEQFDELLEERRHFDSFLPWYWSEDAKQMYEQMQSKFLTQEHWKPFDNTAWKKQKEEAIAFSLNEGAIPVTKQQIGFALSFVSHAGRQSSKMRLVQSFSDRDCVGFVLGKKLSGLPSDAMLFLHRKHGGEKTVLKKMEELTRQTLENARKKQLYSPLCMTFLLTQNAQQWHWSLSQLKPHFSFEHIASHLEELIHPGRSGLWLLLDFEGERLASFATISAFVEACKQYFPLQIHRHKERISIREGALFTNDTSKAKRWLSILFVGKNRQSILEQVKNLLGEFTF